MHAETNRSLRTACSAALVLGLAAFGAGCVNVKDTLTVNADGTGTVEIETISYLGENARTTEMDYGPYSAGPYPPLSASAARNLFPGRDFIVQVKHEKTAAGEPVIIVKATFKDVNMLIDSPYGKAHSLWMGVDGATKTLTVKALTGLQAFPALESMADKSADMPADAKMKELKEKMEKLRVDFTLRLPAAVKAEGAAVNGNEASWSVDRAAIKDPAKTADALRAVMTASCSSESVKFAPVSPVRLDLGSFAEIKEGPAGDKPASVDAEKVLAAAKFVPLFFQSARTFELAGEGYGRENSASLVGVLVLPAALAPQNWSQAELTEAVDDQGNSLVPKEKERGYGRYGYRQSYRNYGAPEEKSKPPADFRCTVGIAMKPPLPAVKALSRVKASVELKYAGMLHVIKVKDAVKAPPAPGNGKENVEGPWEMQESTLSHPKLDEFGVKIAVQGALYRRGMTVIMMKRSGRGASVTAIQVFDAGGRAWPTMNPQIGGDGDDESIVATVAGRPAGPLSLAFVIEGGGPTVKVPIVLTDVPIVPNEMKDRPAENKDAPYDGGGLFDGLRPHVDF